MWRGLTQKLARRASCRIHVLIHTDGDTHDILDMVRYSEDLKMAAVRLRHRGRDSVKDIIHITTMSRPTLFRTWRKHRLTRSVAHKQPIGAGRQRSVLFRDAEYLLRLARHSPTTFLDEYCRRLHSDRYLPIHFTTIHRFFVRAGLRVKHVQKTARERDPLKRADYIRCIGKHSPACLVFLDEVSKNDRVYARMWGRAGAGEQVECYAPFVRGRWVSMLAALALDKGIIAAKVVEGSFTTESFMTFLRHDLVRVYPFCLASLVYSYPMCSFQQQPATQGLEVSLLWTMHAFTSLQKYGG